MVAPAPGFTARVMERIQVQERARVRRRTLVGAGLLAVSSATLLVLAGWMLLSVVEVFIVSPETIAPVWGGLELLVTTVQSIIEALWVAAVAFVVAVGSLQLLGYSLLAFALTLLWLRVVSGPFQRPFTRSRWEV